MLNSLRHWFGSLGNSRRKSVSVPVFDGAFRPNNLLEEAEVLVERPGLEDLAVDSRGQLFAACGATLCQVADDGATVEIASFDRSISALTVLADDHPAVGLGDRVVTAVGSDNENVIQAVDGKPLVAVTALFAQSDGGLLVCDGSDQHACADWAWDLMGKNAGGRLIRLDPASGETKVIAAGLAYAFGAFEDSDNNPLVSESWRHIVSRVTSRATGNNKTPAIDRLPGYPCRFARAEDGGFWLSLFCSRTQLVEFVLKENDYRREMMKTIEPRHWISPSFGSGEDFLEPLQGGGVKQMGFLKPWAPPRSYGLLVRYSADLIPQFSLHSRVGGKHHGISAAAQLDDRLYVLSKGAGRILKLSVSKTTTALLGSAT